MKTLRNLVCISAAVLASALSVHATPYASEVTNSNGTIQFYLNEMPNSVVVTFEDHSTVTLPSPVVGQNSFALGSHTSYSIAVSKVGAGTPTQISTDGSAFPYYWSSPRGLDVYVNPKNSYFGRIYIANSAVGVEGKGLFILNADESSEAGSTNGLEATPFAGSGSSGPYRLGIGAGDGNVYVGDLSAADADVYMFDPNLINTPVPVLGGIGTNAGISAGIHGEIFGAPRATGSTAAGNLVVWTTDYDMAVDTDGANSTLGYQTMSGEFNNINQYVIGGASFPWSGQPNLAINAQVPTIATLNEEVDIGPKTGEIYLANYRNNWVAPNLEIFDPTGMTLLWDSITSDGGSIGSGPDWFNPAITCYSTYINGTTPTGTGTNYAAGTVSPFSVKVSPDEKFVACGLINNPIFIMNLNNGIPDPTTLQIIPNYPNTTGYEDLRALTWDAADNVYTVSSGMHFLRIFSLGLTTMAITSNDSTGTNGTFTMTTPSVSTSVTATTPQAYQANNSYAANGSTPVSAAFTITLSAAQTGSLPVTFTLGGTATNTVNYYVTNNGVRIAGPPYTVTFPAGTTSETVTVTPTASPVSGPTLTVVLSLNSGAAYSAVSPSVATAYIASSGPQALSVGAIFDPTMYRGTPGDYVAFQVIRYGDTNIAWTIPASTFSYSGTAKYPTDYTGLIPALTVNIGDTSETAVVSNPQQPTPFPFTYVGNESIIVTLSGGTSSDNPTVPYTIAGASTATMTLLDNANPPETVVYSDPLTNPNDTGWNLAFGSEATGTAATPMPTLILNYNQSTAPDNMDAAHDYEVEFGVPWSSDPLIATGPPSGASNVLHVTINKIGSVTYVNSTGGTVAGAVGGVALYPAGPTGIPLSFSGNYSLRFSELTYEDTGGSATEYTDWGINHYGTNSIWWDGSYNGGAGNTNIDGVWYSLSCDQGGASYGDVLEFTSTSFPNAGWINLGSMSWNNFTTIFKHPPYNSYPTPGGGSFATGYGNLGTNWNDVEVKQVNNIITLMINKSVIYTYTNTSGLWKKGDIMLGYGDPFTSIGQNGEAYFSNVRVVQLTGPSITSVGLSGTNVVITFTSNDTDAAPSSFTVESSSAVNGTYTATTATITQAGAIYTAVTPGSSSGAKFFIIKQSNVVQ